MKSGIYTITNLIDNKIYLGYTFYFNKRRSDHFDALRRNTHPNIYLQRAFNKYGTDNFKFEILVECKKDFLSSEEHYWATILKVHDDRYGYNLRPTHPYGRVGHSTETKKKMSINRKGKGRKKGYMVSEETKRKIGNIHRGKIVSKEVREKMSEKKNKPIYQLDKNGILIKEWKSTKQAKEIGGFDRSNIIKCLNNKTELYRSYRWKRKI
jgi:group I intron endonuclease